MYLQRQAVLLCSFFIVLIGLTSSYVRAEVNITLEDTASQIIYSPSACGLTLSSDGTEAQTVADCDSAWRIIAAQEASGGTLTTTSGPTDGSGDVIPQLFLSELNSSLEFISIVGLPEDRISTLALTFVQSDRTTHVDIDSITVSISDNNTTPFVAPSLPPSTVLPTVTPSIVIPTYTQPPHHSGQTSGAIAAEVLGSLLGAIIIAAAVFVLLYFRRKRRRPASSSAEEKEET
ncbi:hypothetical protein ONZ51_g8421 [Trametes cubensis]|uniref:Uncharacterized protein n=1 Tax=Trametes cubensis TaxID=1111947 RepID=A0AAD7TN91_9APHY|nr:hypothetical protein ONZ51_g8421 [Trametes cubensis]